MNSPQPNEQFAIIIADLTYGDAGKGSIIDFLARHFSADVVIRYNGGAQAGHNVVTPDGRHHTFAQFGSGMFVPYTKTVLSRFMILDPLAMLNEANHLQELGVDSPFERTSIDHRARVITPYQQAANRLKELARGENRHGSCGMGVGETVSDHLQHGDKMLFAGDLCDPILTAQKLAFIQGLKHAEIGTFLDQIPPTEQAEQALATFDDPDLINACCDVYGYFADCVNILDEDGLRDGLSSAKTLLFEGAQGVLLDEDYGFHPYTTWSKTTFINAETVLDEMDFNGKVAKVGLTRAYTTRHGAGPFISEDPALTVPDQHNGLNEWQREFRVGYLDTVALKYALEVVGDIDFLAVTNLDRLADFPTLQICDAYHYSGDPNNLLSYFEHDGLTITGIKVSHPPTLDHQARLTELLFDCRPCYQPISSDDYLPFIEKKLGVPIAITSHGPTADDKMLMAIWQEQFSE